MISKMAEMDRIGKRDKEERERGEKESLMKTMFWSDPVRYNSNHRKEQKKERRKWREANN